MTTSTRRDFIKTSTAAAAGAVLVGGNVAAQTVTLEIIISGLCVVVKTATGVDVLLPAAAGHDQQLTYSGNNTMNIKDHQLVVAGLPAGAVTLPILQQCDNEARWFADLRNLYPNQALVSYPERAKTRQIASFIRLSGGTIELVDSDPAVVLGMNRIWDLSWEANTTRQLLVEVARYSVSVDPAALTLTATPMSGGTPKSIPLNATAGQTVSLSISNEKPSSLGLPRNRIGYLQHFNEHALIFKTPPANKRDPESTSACSHLPSPPSPVSSPSATLVNELRKRQAQVHSTSQGHANVRIQAGTQVFMMTASDPICPIAYYEAV